MARERGGQRLPLAHQPRHLLLGGLALAGDGPCTLPVDVEGGIGQRPADLLPPRPEGPDARPPPPPPAAQIAHPRPPPPPSPRARGGGPGRRRRGACWG